MTAAPEPGRGTSGSRAPLVVLLLVLAAQAGFHLAWFARDARIPFWDQHRYYAMTRAALDLVDEPGGAGWTHLLDLHPSHPPLYSLLGAVAERTVGNAFFGARLVNLALAALTTLATFGLARRRLEKWPSVLAAGFAATAPMLVSMAHLYYLENLLGLLVVLSFDVLVRNRGLARPLPALLFGVLAGLGALTKWTYPVFVAPAAAVVVVARRQVLGAGIALATALAIAGPWYVTHLAGIRNFLDEGVTGGFGHLSAVTGLDGWIYYPKALVLAAVGVPLTLSAAIGAFILVRRDRRCAVLLGLALLLPIVFFALVMTKKPRHLLPLVPLVAVLAAVPFAVLRRAAVARVLAGLLLLHTALASSRQAFGFPPLAADVRLFSRKLPLFARSQSDDPGRPDAVRWPYREIVDDLVAAAPDRPGGRVLVLFNSVAFRDVGFAYEVLVRRLPFEFGLLPLHLPPGHPGHRPYPLDEEGTESVFGVRAASWILAKGGTVWVRVQSGEPVHKDAARLNDALLDEDPLLAAAFTFRAERPLPDRSFLRVYAADGPTEARDDALARFALRYSRDHAGAWHRFGGAPDAPAERDRRLVELGVLPAEFARVQALARGGAGHEIVDHELDALTGFARDREDLLDRFLDLASPDHGARPGLVRLRRLREATRIESGLPDPELALADLMQEAGETRLRYRWLARALLAGCPEAEVLARLPEPMAPALTGPALRAALRARSWR